MLRSMSSAVSGLRSHQVMMDVLSNDIANVNTIGFKAQRMEFKDVLFQNQRNASAASGATGSVNPAQVGLGAQIGGISNLMSQGAFTNTGNPLDLAINGEGFFRVTDDPAGFANVTLTRAGNFGIDSGGRLVTNEGLFVIGNTIDPVTGAPTATQTTITIPAGAKSVSVDSLGKVSVVDSTGANVDIAYLSLGKSPNPAGLERVSGNRWQESVASGVTTVANAASSGLGSISSGTLELSNVDLSVEFSNMIVAQRGFQANSRTITTADEMLQTLIQMKR